MEDDRLNLEKKVNKLLYQPLLLFLPGLMEIRNARKDRLTGVSKDQSLHLLQKHDFLK